MKSKIKVKKRDRWWKVFCQECSVEWRFNAWEPSTYRRKPYSDSGAYNAILHHLNLHHKMESRISRRSRRSQLRVV